MTENATSQTAASETAPKAAPETAISEAAPATATAISFTCDQEGVKQLLPHRNPFLWVTRIVECDPGHHIVAELDVDPALPIFEGHFPGHPVFPGVLIMEALAQAACCCIFAQTDVQVGVGYLAGIDKARFRETVLPGDTVRLEATIVQSSRRFVKAEVHAWKGDKLAAEATQRYMLAG